ncbi:hypothetical protein NUU61_002182 [Penicillium alfredii]|uniref:Uncharacterized protein n=1 Tax=Penicillium alfredii TaxID=1506179 RepID=A0A9W9KFS1_9EURO|nr:uncharacterized protein NUU61_002182 [Penicillium alfredii]KAJ5104835.1 hypothetical protein NUU61_002182 [Penicillium alfredii]
MPSIHCPVHQRNAGSQVVICQIERAQHASLTGYLGREKSQRDKKNMVHRRCICVRQTVNSCQERSRQRSPYEDNSVNCRVSAVSGQRKELAMQLRQEYLNLALAGVHAKSAVGKGPPDLIVMILG